MKTATPKKTQTQRLLTWLRKYRKGVTQLEAFIELGICRLSERIRELIREGYAIVKTRELASNGATVTRYKLAR
jgi:hypothetical protein